MNRDELKITIKDMIREINEEAEAALLVTNESENFDNMINEDTEITLVEEGIDIKGKLRELGKKIREMIAKLFSNIKKFLERIGNKLKPEDKKKLQEIESNAKEIEGKINNAENSDSPEEMNELGKETSGLVKGFNGLIAFFKSKAGEGETSTNESVEFDDLTLDESFLLQEFNVKDMAVGLVKKIVSFIKRIIDKIKKFFERLKNKSNKSKKEEEIYNNIKSNTNDLRALSNKIEKMNEELQNKINVTEEVIKDITSDTSKVFSRVGVKFRDNDGNIIDARDSDTFRECMINKYTAIL